MHIMVFVLHFLLFSCCLLHYFSVVCASLMVFCLVNRLYTSIGHVYGQATYNEL